MMKIPKFPTLKLGGPSAPTDAKKIADWLDPHIRQLQVLTQSAQKFGSLQENLNVELQTVPFRQNEELEISSNVKVGIAGVYVIDSEVRTQPIPQVRIRRITNSLVGLRMTWDTNPSGFKDVTFLVVGS